MTDTTVELEEVLRNLRREKPVSSYIGGLAIEAADALAAQRARIQELEALRKDAARYRWLRDKCEWSEDSHEEVETIKEYADGSVRTRVVKKTFWDCSFRDTWELCVWQKEQPSLDDRIDAALSAGDKS